MENDIPMTVQKRIELNMELEGNVPFCDMIKILCKIHENYINYALYMLPTHDMNDDHHHHHELS